MSERIESSPLTRWRAPAIRKIFRGSSVADILATVFLILLFVAVTAPGLLTPYDPLVPDQNATLQSLSLVHPFGTDYMGRDLLARVIYGTRRTVAGSLVAVVIGLLSGISLGLLAAYFGKFADAVIGRRAAIAAIATVADQHRGAAVPAG